MMLVEVPPPAPVDDDPDWREFWDAARIKRAAVRGRIRRARWLACLAWLTGVAAVIGLIVFLPWFIGFAIAVIGGAAWCKWLEDHVDS